MKLHLVGAYLPKLTPERLSLHIAEDKQHFVAVAVPSLQTQGFLSGLSDQAIWARAEEIAAEKSAAIERAAIFEVAVSQNSGAFDLGEIEGAWEPAYLTPDGQALLEDLGLSVANAMQFRVAFYIHDWPEREAPSLCGGKLAAREFTPVPERIWRLAPYALVD